MWKPLANRVAKRSKPDAAAAYRRIVVLGGSSDLARAVLVVMAGRGVDHVVLAGRHLAALERVGDDLRSLGVGRVDCVTFDAKDIDSHEKVASTVTERIGEIDLLLVATGVLSSSQLDELTPRRVADEITTNFTGLASAMTVFTQVLRTQGHGRIVVFSTAAAVRARRASFVYGASKAGLDAFSQGLGDALFGSGVQMTIVRPGFVRTKMTAGRPPLPMATTTEAVGRAVVEGIDAGSAVVWVPRTLRYVMPVVPHVPRAIWRRVPR
jgi:decaprenylphospho-beta-D-erythro-pentofuranosid-2-ulose 2-reductase